MRRSLASGDPLVQDRAGVFESDLPDGFEEIRDRHRRAHQALHDVQGVDQALIEEIEMADDLAAMANLDGEALGS
jgi:hypothetical protein